MLHYPDQSPVPLIQICGGLTSGTRTRIDHGNPHMVDEFVRRFQQQ